MMVTPVDPAGASGVPGRASGEPGRLSGAVGSASGSPAPLSMVDAAGAEHAASANKVAASRRNTGAH
jgi:hypothetical protein